MCGKCFFFSVRILESLCVHSALAFIFKQRAPSRGQKIYIKCFMKLHFAITDSSDASLKLTGLLFFVFKEIKMLAIGICSPLLTCFHFMHVFFQGGKKDCVWHRKNMAQDPMWRVLVHFCSKHACLVSRTHVNTVFLLPAAIETIPKVFGWILLKKSITYHTNVPFLGGFFPFGKLQLDYNAVNHLFFFNKLFQSARLHKNTPNKQNGSVQLQYHWASVCVFDKVGWNFPLRIRFHLSSGRHFMFRTHLGGTANQDRQELLWLVRCCCHGRLGEE